MNIFKRYPVPAEDHPHAFIKVLGAQRKVYGRPGETYFDWLSNKGEYGGARDLTAYCLALKPDSVCLDLGANIGFTSLIMASLCPQGHVYSFVPGAGTYANLCRTIAANGVGDICTPVNMAVSDHKGRSRFREWGPNGYLTETDNGSGADGDTLIEVDITTVDDWAVANNLTSLTFMKIDVEGHELATLRGARQTINRFKPAALIEFFTAPDKMPPMELLNGILGVFPHVTMVDHVTGLPVKIERDHDSKQAFLNANNAFNRVDDLFCYFDEAQVSPHLLAAFKNIELAADWRARQPPMQM